jgi:Na+-driven multidrug efflux pump
MSFSVAYQNAVTGTGNTRITLLIELFAIIGYSVYVFIVLEVLHLSIIIGWMSEWLYWLTFFGFSYWYIRSGRWKKKVL